MFGRAVSLGPTPTHKGYSVTVVLSPQQRKVAALVAEGLTEAEIAKSLGLAKSTVKSHKQAIYHKLGARNAVEMARALSE